MELLLSKHFLLICALVVPLFQCLAQIFLISLIPSDSLHYALNRVNRIFGVLSLIITVTILGMFFNVSESAANWIIHYRSRIPLRFTLSHLSLLFWSSKNIMIFLVETFSYRYFFREPGVGKFYSTISIFSFALNLVFLSGSFAPFTLGWELMGLTSVVLIAYFDRRRASVERSFLALLFYKLGDFFLLAALLYVANTTTIQSFGDFRELVTSRQDSFILCLFALAVFVKSGLLPFSFWLPRAMEGPTPSSALFYGALSAHAGVFLLLRISIATGGMGEIPSVFIVFVGVATALFAYLMAITRTDIKSQIIYSVLCQVSVIFIEIGLGWTRLAQIHTILHMFFRLFQFLIAPSAIYLSHEKAFLRNEKAKSPEKISSLRQNCLHLIWWLSLHEFGLAIFWKRFALEPILVVGQFFSKINRVIQYSVKKTLPLFLRSTQRKNNDLIRFIFFLAIVSIPAISKSHRIVSILGVALFQIMALGFSLITIQEKKLSRSFFNLIFSGAFLLVSYYFSTNAEHVPLFYSHLIFSVLGLSILGWLFIYFRNAFDLSEGQDFIGLNRISPFLSAIFAILILFILGFPGFSTYFSLELMSEDLSEISAIAAISGLAILNINAYLWFNIYTRLFWGIGPSHIHISDL